MFLRRQLARTSPEVRVSALAAALFGVSLLAWWLPAPATVEGSVVPPWWVLAVLVAAAEIWVFRIRVRRVEQGMSLGELPLAVGLLTISPALLVTARVLGTAAVLVFYRRTTPLKTAFNVAMVAAGAALSAAIYHLVAGSATVVQPEAWLGVVAATAFLGAYEELVFACLVGWYSEWPSPRALLRRAALETLRPGAVGVVGLLAGLGLSLGPRAVPPIIGGAAVALVAYRSYATLSDRHASLEGLFRLSGELNDALSVEQVALATLKDATDLVGGGYGELAVERPGSLLSRWHTDGEGEPVVEHVQAGDESVTCLQDTAAYLRERGLDEVLAVRIRLSEGRHGLLAIGRRNAEWRSWRRRNEQLLETVARQASVALRHAFALEQLTHEARHDKLTGLLNRAAFQVEADAAMREVGRGLRPAVGILDLDGFKTLNDSLGHHAGDLVISEVGRRMNALRDDRIVVARLGGDEFALLLRDHANEDDVVAVGRRLMACLSGDVNVEGKRVHLAGSLGLAVAPRDGVTADALLRCADLSMYAAKRGSGGIAVFGRDIGHPAGDPVALAADLRLALSRGEVTIAVQPLIDLRNRELHSVEVLARWRHAGLGLVEPETFVAAAERGGLTGELTRVVLGSALRACRSWLDAGLEVRVAVNLSARAIDDPDLPQRVESALAEHGVPGRLLALELTEGGLLDNPDRVRPVLQRLRQLGIRLAIDDFGTGYSSMTYVSSLAPDQVKIDKSFVQRVLLRGRDAAIVRSIIDLGNNLGVEVVAEGVSDPVTARAVQDLGCSLAQGFLFAEPMAWQNLPGWVGRLRTEGSGTAGKEQGQGDQPDEGGSERLRLVR